MQALLVLALFGSLLAAIGSLISASVGTTQQLIVDQIHQVETYFRQAESILLDKVTQDNMQIPVSACPDTTTYAATDIRGYLCRTDVAQLAEWAGSSGGLVDPWKSAIIGYAVRPRNPYLRCGARLRRTLYP